MKVCKKETSNQLLFRLIFILANKFDQNTTYITDTETDKFNTVMYCDTYIMLILVLRCLEFCYCVKLGCVERRGDLYSTTVVEPEGCSGCE